MDKKITQPFAKGQPQKKNNTQKRPILKKLESFDICQPEEYKRI